jgi:HEAT repeat protein/cyclophilin family peptidyl-prolyl cis-trans isomerase
MNRWLKIVALLVLVSVPLSAQKRRALSPADIDDIATLLKLEDTRNFDEAELGRIVKSAHPEVRRRAVMSMGRIVNDKAKPMLAALHTDKDPEIVATVAWATGQQKDAGAIPWLSSLLAAKTSPAAVVKEAAQALGKIITPESYAALTTFLKNPPSGLPAPAVGEALLSAGRFGNKEDITEILRYAASPNVELRWRAAWALFRARNPLAVPVLLKLSGDVSPDVRFWSMRGLALPAIKDSTVTADVASARLRTAVNDTDRRVRTEALRALATHDDDASVAVVLDALNSPDTWLSTSAAELLGSHASRAAQITPKLVAAGAAGKPLALRIFALRSLAMLASPEARTLAAALALEDNVTARNDASAAIRNLDAAAARAAGTAPAGRAGGGGRGNAQPPVYAPRPDAEYRALVTTWIVPHYMGTARAPHVVFDTLRGPIEIELHPGDAPFGVEYLMDVVTKGDIVGTEFGRVVPNFVDQENAIRPTGRLRDEVNRHGLLRGTLAWASAGLDTGRPGYTLGSTPQPHNEGNFTSLGTIVKGMDAVDHIELGDKITGARILK